MNGNNAPKKSLKVLFVSIDALIGDTAWAVKKEGHEVKYYIQDKEQKDVCDGFVDKVDDWKDETDWADLIVFDDFGFGEEAEKLRKAGKAVVGGSIYTDKLEMDREFGQSEMKAVGISIIPRWNFTNFDDAVEFIVKNPDRYVLKPSGLAQNEKELLFVGQEEDGKDIVEMLERYKKNWGKKIKEFQIQKYISGVEVAVGAFFNGEDFIYPINVNFEHKRMFPGDIGPSTGEMGTTMFFTNRSPIFEATLVKMKEKLAASGYVGYIDINCIVNSRGIYPLEFTSRFGYPHISICMEGVLSEWGTFLYGIAKKEKPELRTKRAFEIGIVVAVPPFPFNDPESFKRYSEDASIIFKKPNFEGVHPGDVKFVDNDWRLAGNSGYALVVTGSGTTMEEARKIVYNRIRNIIIPNMFYRTDIGVRWVEDSDRLTMWGYL
ncbi:Phosphoribosylamine--glycine ligase [Candidatus Bilamarchaeum dharawalense]|uniref:phosphoribosylamine--glycine ligase n=1 Tax=Candidatus Bilamarchaeum dharawalense TaxID=2885759 RepID=A0A5E4LQ28_9ARCH|nr:Phosphoribosylamine--glycine ligase [Candidatus Bilamarchaeum dharawalense]